jgi:hypothetical protein
LDTRNTWGTSSVKRISYKELELLGVGGDAGFIEIFMIGNESKKGFRMSNIKGINLIFQANMH